MQKIRVVAVNHFPFSSFSLRDKILLGCKIPKSLKIFSCLKISGSDASQFLQGQTTQDVFLYQGHSNKYPFENAVLDGSGRLQVPFSQWEESHNHWRLVVDSKLKLVLMDRLSKFIISEDVEIEDMEIEETYDAVLGIFSEGPQIPFSLLGSKGHLIPLNHSTEFCNLTEDEFKTFLMLQGSFKNEASLTTLELFTNTIYSEMSLSLTKGCFLGQETVAKIVSRRGASHYPTLLVTSSLQNFGVVQKISFQDLDLKILGQGNFDNKFYFLIHMPRELRIPKNKIQIMISNESLDNSECEVEIIFAPLFPYQLKSVAEDTYFSLLNLANQNAESKELAAYGLEIFISQYPNYIDAYEMRGVLLTQLKKYPDAIDCFKKLNEIDPNSVMACVNLSRIYGELGEIQQAEDYKAEAIVRSFQVNAINAEKTESNKFNTAAIQHDPSKIQMFIDVLEIDPEDRFAKNQLSQIYCDQKEWKKLERLLEGMDTWQLIKTDPEFAIPLFELNKNLYQDPLAQQILLKGIESAAKQGKQKLIAEIQAALQLLTSNSP